MRYQEIIRLDERLQDIVQSLGRYKDRDDVFISFRSIPKLGINPQSSYDTPIGIYSYPLKEIWRSIVLDTIPFASDQPYVIVFATTGFIPDVNPQAENGYTEEMYNRDIAKFTSMYFKRFSEHWNKVEHTDHTYGNQKKYMVAVEDILQNDPNEQAKSMAKFVDSFFSNGTQWWLGNKKLADDGYLTQESFQKIYRLMKNFEAGEPFHGVGEVDEIEHKTQFDFLIKHWAEEANLDTPCSKLWNVTRNFAVMITKNLTSHDDFKGKKNAVAWTAILRNLGYEGFTDKTGSGQIHGNEPCQAVFFSLKSIKLLEVVQNVRKDHKKTIDNLGELTALLRNGSATIALDKILPETLLDFSKLISTGKTKYITVKDHAVFLSNLREELPAFIVVLQDKLCNQDNKKFSIFAGFASWYLSDASSNYRSSSTDKRFVETIARAGYYFNHTKTWKKVVADTYFQYIAKEYPSLFQDIMDFNSQHKPS